LHIVPERHRPGGSAVAAIASSVARTASLGSFAHLDDLWLDPGIRPRAGTVA
jgi:hypothetical protein